MNLSAFDLNLLKVLDALLRERSTVRAGERVGLSQPAVSAALGRLRAAFGDPLLMRDGQQMRPTEFALALVLPLTQLLEDSSRLLNPASFDPVSAVQTFRIAASDFFTEMMLPGLMANLEQRAPGISLRYTDSLSLQTMDDLREARLDLILLPAGNFSPWVDWRPIFHASYVVVARQDHPVLRQHGVTPAAAMPVELYCSLRHAAFRVIEMAPDRETAALAALGLQREVVLSVPTFTAVLRSVAATNLVGIVPRRMAVKVATAEGLAIHPLPFALPPTLLAMIWHRRNSASRPHAWLRDQVSEILTSLDDLEQSSVGSLVLGSAGNLD
ncbi:LysR family transcriptional regulator [Rhizobium ruizarguesonis]|uniref:LysR family transcriptional regulator n=1 Tax=Rhizobium ruizarguesonis TaxID=2081791 RepID=UPI0010321A0C|nr:LysR family transcriptional regulator [Rhizobium ruizarguesonis]TAZ46824.1 LysR family transcriptional regulator [Rhizobium ruizarguesonis]